jgi:chromate reductase
MDQSLSFIGISGSLRKASYNTRLLEIAQGLLPDGVKMEIVSLVDLPLYNGDVEEEGFPLPVLEFRKKVFKADAILFASPEYNSSFTGVLKNAIDWASRAPRNEPYPTYPLAGKPFAIIGVGGRYGTARSQSHLRQVLQKLDMPGVNHPEVLIQNEPVIKFDANLNLTDVYAIKLIEILLKKLVRLVHQTKVE